jgi:hypothetical protein
MQKFLLAAEESFYYSFSILPTFQYTSFPVPFSVVFSHRLIFFTVYRSTIQNTRPDFALCASLSLLYLKHGSGNFVS